MSKRIRKTLLFKQVAIPVMICFSMTSVVHSQNSEDLSSELKLIDSQIAEVEETINEYGTGLISEVARTRKEILLLLKNAIQLRQEIDSNDLEVETVFPVMAPNAEEAQKIQKEIVEAESRVKQLKLEAEKSGDLIQALALSRLETEKLSLTQLRMAYFQKKYGIAFTTGESGQISSEPASVQKLLPRLEISDSNEVVNEQQNPVEESEDANNTPQFPWSDPKFPEIDYSLPIFQALHNDGADWSGWWSINQETAPIDDSPSIVAVNYSNFNYEHFRNPKSLAIACTEGSTRIMYLVDAFLLTEFNNNSHEVTIRIDSEPAQTENWTVNHYDSVILYDEKAQILLRELYNAKKLFIRLVEISGELQDSLFDLSGIQKIIDLTADACNWTTYELKKENYQTIQTYLNEHGFNAGKSDGVWGDLSKNALRQFQEEYGLKPTGMPDKATLEMIGFEQ